jgi:lipoprotein-anchoring transpeptidase ErfK/SrfK
VRDDHGNKRTVTIGALRPWLALLVVALLAAGCGAARRSAPRPTTVTTVRTTPRQKTCAPGARTLGSARRAYVGVATNGAVAYRRPGGRVVIARFGPKNANDYPTLFGVVGKIVGRDCAARWYRVQLPVRPNGATGFVRASELDIQSVTARIVVDVSSRTLTLYRHGRRVFSATVAVGSPATPTPIGRFYVNQRLIPEDTAGPFGPAAIGISAFSNVLTGWTQGGPVAIHGTNEPWSIGHAVSNGCVRLPNATLTRLFRVAVAGTPVIIKA